MVKRLRIERWSKRLLELKAAEKVKLKQLESLAKDSNHPDIQLDCKAAADLLQQQLVKCRRWSELQSQADLNSNSDILKLLELGKANLEYNLCDFVDLRNFHQDMLGWRETTKRLLSGEKQSHQNYEFVRKHIETGRQLIEIGDDHQIEVLTAMVEVCAHWKNVARKVLGSRELAKLDNSPHIFEEVKAGDPPSMVDVDCQFAVHLMKSGSNFEIERVTTPYDVEDK
jgi:hypothetical protein